MTKEEIQGLIAKGLKEVTSSSKVVSVFKKGTALEVAEVYQALNKAFGDKFTCETELYAEYGKMPVETLLKNNKEIFKVFKEGAPAVVAKAYQALNKAFGDKFTCATKLHTGHSYMPVETLLKNNKEIFKVFKEGKELEVVAGYKALNEAFGDKFTGKTELHTGHSYMPVEILVKHNVKIAIDSGCLALSIEHLISRVGDMHLADDVQLVAEEGGAAAAADTF